MASLRTPAQFKSRKAKFLSGLVGLVLMYALATRAIDTGSWWQYLGSFLLLILSLRLLIHSIKK